MGMPQIQMVTESQSEVGTEGDSREPGGHLVGGVGSVISPQL